jgi:hypothetical protein
MRSAVIDRRLMYLEQLFLDLKEINDDIRVAGDPSLIMEYEEEKKVLFKDLEEQAMNVLYLLEAYIEDCKTENLPIVIEYYRVLKELSHARREQLLHME